MILRKRKRERFHSLSQKEGIIYDIFSHAELNFDLGYLPVWWNYIILYYLLYIFHRSNDDSTRIFFQNKQANFFSHSITEILMASTSSIQSAIDRKLF